MVYHDAIDSMRRDAHNSTGSDAGHFLFKVFIQGVCLLKVPVNGPH